MRYPEPVLEHFFAPRNAYRMQAPDVVGRAGTPGRGNFMLLYLRLDGARVLEASYQTYGCCPAIAAGSLLVEQLADADLAEARARWTEPAINAALGGLPRHKRHCSRLAAEALEHAFTQLSERTRKTDSHG